MTEPKVVHEWESAGGRWSLTQIDNGWLTVSTDLDLGEGDMEQEAMEELARLAGELEKRKLDEVKERKSMMEVLSNADKERTTLQARVEELEGEKAKIVGIVEEGSQETIDELEDENKRLWEAVEKAEVVVCSCCGEPLPTKSLPSSAWHTLGDRWEHKCPGVHSQAGHFPTVPFAKYQIAREAVGGWGAALEEKP